MDQECKEFITYHLR